MEQNEKSGKLLEVKDLRVSFFTPAGEVKAVSGISYDLDYDEVMGIVGESGSGKSQEAYSIMGLLQSPGKVIGGSITFEGRDVLAFSKKEMASFRGSEVAMIFQNPMTCLNPVYTVGNQLIEALRAHDKKISKADAAKRAMEMLEHLPEPGEVFEYDGFTVQVLEVDEQRVTRLRVTFDRSRSSMEAKDNDD